MKGNNLALSKVNMYVRLEKQCGEKLHNKFITCNLLTGYIGVMYSSLHQVQVKFG